MPSPTRRPSGRLGARVTSGRLPRRVWLAAAGVFALAVVVRFLDTRGLPNDHFLYLAPAQQMVTTGEWPSRDFVDPGTPAMYVVSALAQRLLGPPLFAEAWLVAIAFALSAALTVAAAFRLSNRLWLAMAVAVAQIALFPRSYHYPKYLVYAWLALALIAYLHAPTRRRAARLALVVVVGFLFRHDHGVYAGVAVAIAVLLAGPWDRAAVQRVGTVAGFALAFVAPYLAFVSSTTGLIRHVSGGVAYSAAESARTSLGVPTLPWHELLTADGRLIGYFYLLHLLPLAALGLLYLRWRQASPEVSRVEAVTVVSLVALTVALNVAMLRKPLDARLPDVAVSAGLLLAWMLPVAWRLRPRLLLRPAAVAAAAVALRLVYQVGDPLTHLERTELLERPGRPLFLINLHADELNARFDPHMFSSWVMEELLPFFKYVERCTSPAQRLFVAGDLPEIYVLARRPFAGGQPALRGGLFTTVADQQRLVAKMSGQDVPLAIVDPDGDAPSFHTVMQELETRFDRVGDVPMRREGRSRLLVLVNRAAAPAGIDAATGWPCFR